MSAISVHRIVERQAADRGEQIAIAGPECTLTYRELNQRANGVARDLIVRGLRRGSHAVVRIQRGPHLAVVLLAILKAGASYMWVEEDADGRWPYGVSLVDGGDPMPVVLDAASIADAPARPAPNLPIVTRPEDIACLLPQRNRLPGVLIPHATITSLQAHPVPARSTWSGDAGALDLWLSLMAGATVTIDAAASRVAAA